MYCLDCQARLVGIIVLLFSLKWFCLDMWPYVTAIIGYNASRLAQAVIARSLLPDITVRRQLSIATIMCIVTQSRSVRSSHLILASLSGLKNKTRFVRQDC